MRREQHRAPLALEPLDQSPELPSRLRVEPARGLIQKQNLRVPDSAQATASRCFWPPDSFEYHVCRLSVSETSSSRLWTSVPLHKTTERAAAFPPRSACPKRLVSCSEMPAVDAAIRIGLQVRPRARPRLKWRESSLQGSRLSLSSRRRLGPSSPKHSPACTLEIQPVTAAGASNP